MSSAIGSAPRVRRDEMLIALTVNGKRSGDADVADMGLAAFFFNQAARALAEEQR